MKYTLVATVGIVAALSAAPVAAETTLVIEGLRNDQVVASIEIPLPKENDIPFKFDSSTGVPIVTAIENGDETTGVAKSGVSGSLMVLDRDPGAVQMYLSVEWQSIRNIEEVLGVSLVDADYFFTEQTITAPVNGSRPYVLLEPNGPEKTTLKMSLVDPAFPK